MRTLLIALLLAPLQAAAWSVIVPTSDENPCILLNQHQVEAVVGPNGGQAVTELQFNALDDTDAHILLPELASGVTAAWLDGEKVIFERLEGQAAVDQIATLALARVRPTLLRAAHRPLLSHTVALSQGPHTLRIEAPIPVEWDAATPHLMVPLQTLGTACHRIPVQATIEIESATPIGVVFTPFHDAIIERADPHNAVVRVQGDAQRNDLHVYLSTADADVAANVLTWRAPACDGEDSPGYLLVAAGATTTEQADAVPKDVMLVVDRSGSMDGAKIEQVRRALGSILTKLGPDDRFDVVAFDGSAESIFGSLQPASDEAARTRAADVVEDLVAGGSTNIHQALLTALAELSDGDADRPRVIVFLTDGQATAGITDTDEILADVAAANEIGARLFAFGVGHQVNTRLLDELSLQTGVNARYIQPGADIDAVLTDFYRDIQAPILTDVELVADGIDLLDRQPLDIPDLYLGGRLLIASRFNPEADGRLDLTGRTSEGDARFNVAGDIVRVGEQHAFLPRLWASRRMAELLYEARQNGGEDAFVEEITALAWRFGFVTRFTQFRVADNGSVQAGYSNPTGDEVGEEAVGTSSDINSMSENGNAGRYTDDNGAVDMVHVLDRTFVHDHAYWRDTTVPLAPRDVVDVEIGSADWRTLLDAGAGPFLAVGRNVLFQWRCRTVRITDPDLVEDVPTQDRLPAELTGNGPGEERIGDRPLDPADIDREEGCAAVNGPSSVLALLGFLLLGIRRRSSIDPARG